MGAGRPGPDAGRRPLAARRSPLAATVPAVDPRVVRIVAETARAAAERALDEEERLSAVWKSLAPSEQFDVFLEREELRRRIEFDPDLFVAQERVEHSTAPVWQKDSLAPQPVSLRAFLVADGQGGYCVMPGGLARVSPDSGGKFISMQTGGSSKDTWIPSTTPVEVLTLLHGTGQNVELRRTGNNLPSRLADNFFWLGRYSERAAAADTAVADAGNTGADAGHCHEAGIVDKRRSVRGGAAGGDF